MRQRGRVWREEVWGVVGPRSWKRKDKSVLRRDVVGRGSGRKAGTNGRRRLARTKGELGRAAHVLRREARGRGGGYISHAGFGRAMGRSEGGCAGCGGRGDFGRPVSCREPTVLTDSRHRPARRLFVCPAAAPVQDAPPPAAHHTASRALPRRLLHSFPTPPTSSSPDAHPGKQPADSARPTRCPSLICTSSLTLRS